MTSSGSKPKQCGMSWFANIVEAMKMQESLKEQYPDKTKEEIDVLLVKAWDARADSA